MLRSVYRRTVTALIGEAPSSASIARELEPLPIPSDWVIEGEPVATATMLTESKDKRYRSGVWECTAGTFHWLFSLDEIVHILDGEVIVEHAGRTLHLRKGDVAHFPLGAATIWRVPSNVRKFFTHRLRRSWIRALHGV